MLAYEAAWQCSGEGIGVSHVPHFLVTLHVRMLRWRHAYHLSHMSEVYRSRSLATYTGQALEAYLALGCKRGRQW